LKWIRTRRRRVEGKRQGRRSRGRSSRWGLFALRKKRKKEEGQLFSRGEAVPKRSPTLLTGKGAFTKGTLPRGADFLCIKKEELRKRQGGKPDCPRDTGTDRPEFKKTEEERVYP